MWTCASIEELRDRREGKGRHSFFGYMMQVEWEGRFIVRQSFRKKFMKNVQHLKDMPKKITFLGGLVVKCKAGNLKVTGSNPIIFPSVSS